MAAHPETQYLQLMADILKDGRTKPSRGIVPIQSIFGYQLHFDLRHGFPLFTTKKMATRVLTTELIWFIHGVADNRLLNDENVHIWDGFADEDGDLGRIYGVQWRRWRRPDGSELDQLQWAIDEIKSNPNSKSIIVSAWNAGELGEMRLPPCHTLFQFDVTKGKLRLQLYQRSSDVFLGLPFNVAQYALLLHMVAHLTGLEARELVVSIGNAHLYKNQLDAAKEQIRRRPYPFPKLSIVGNPQTIDDFTKDSFVFENYQSHPGIKVPLVIL